MTGLRLQWSWKPNEKPVPRSGTLIADLNKRIKCLVPIVPDVKR